MVGIFHSAKLIPGSVFRNSTPAWDRNMCNIRQSSVQEILLPPSLWKLHTPNTVIGTVRAHRYVTSHSAKVGIYVNTGKSRHCPTRTVHCKTAVTAHLKCFPLKCLLQNINKKKKITRPALSSNKYMFTIGTIVDRTRIPQKLSCNIRHTHRQKKVEYS